MAIPEAGPGEVLVRVAGAGACHSDLHLMEFPPGTLGFSPPFVLGHENTGWVAAQGPGPSASPIGTPVAVYGPWGCGHCRSCRLSAENYCERAGELGKLAPGIGHDGGMAEYLCVPERLLVPLDGLDPVDAAPLTDAGLTPYHAIKRSLALLVPGSTAVVMGAGGLGHLAIQLLRTLTTARVIVIDPAGSSVTKRWSSAPTRPSLRTTTRPRASARATGQLGAELVLDLVGSDDSLALSVACSRGRWAPDRRRHRGWNASLQLLRRSVRVLGCDDLLGHRGRAS